MGNKTYVKMRRVLKWERCGNDKGAETREVCKREGCGNERMGK